MQILRNPFLCFLGLLFIVLGYYPISRDTQGQLAVDQQFQKAVHLKEKQLENRLEDLKDAFGEKGFENSSSAFEKDWEERGFSYFIFVNETLKYWSEDNSSLSADQLLSNKRLLQSGNAWQEKRKISSGDTLFVGLFAIQNNYPYQNQFLQNTFFEDFSFPTVLRIAKFNTSQTKIYTKEEIPLFSIIFKKESQPQYFLAHFFGVIVIVGFLLILHYLPLMIFKSNRKLKITAAILLAIILRIILFYYPPLAWQELAVFQPSHLAIAGWMPSLGDLLLNALLLIYIAVLLPLVVVRSKKSIFHLLFLFIGFIVAAFSVELIQSAVLNSTISFNLNRIFQLSIYSYLCFFAFALVLFAGLSFIYHGSKQLFHLQTFGWQLFYSFLLTAIAGTIVGLLFDFSIAHYWAIVPTLFILLHHKRPSKRNLSIPIFVLLSASLLTAFAIYKVAFVKEAKNRALIVSKLTAENDPVAEYLFNDLQKNLRSDTTLKEYLKEYWKKQEEAESYLFNNFFRGYWDKYKIIFTPCKEGDSLYLNPENIYVSCEKYFENKIKTEGAQVSSNNLFQLQNFPGRIAYLAEVNIPLDSVNYTLYIELVANNFNENEGYPKLLIDEQNQDVNINLSEYSYAVYESNELVYHFGNFNYSRSLKITSLSPTSSFVSRWENHEHFLYQKDKETTIVLSRSTPTTINFLTYWAYLFVFYAFLFFILAATVGNFPFHFRFPFTDFSAKIQFFLIGSLLLTLLFFSIGTTYYIEKQYQEKNAKILAEKVRSINLELEQKFGDEEFLPAQMQDYISNMLIKMSNVFYSDINIYDVNGLLYASSRPEVFDKGLKSRRLNPKAYHALIEKDKAEWVQEEKIGKMTYLSAYIPLKNYNNEVLAYLNLPYFSKQGELEKEISSFLVSTINIYVGIFTLALLVSILLINQLSRPLLMIRNQISRLKLGSSVELIQWDSKDEIGALVKAYNRIAIELNESAEQLAQSEREGAWKEMAKQVAHEIKNPLTPMRLHIQHLQRMEEASSEELKDKLKRTSQNLIEQIDTLSKIADAFSAFAKLPEKELKRIDLLPIIQSAISIYENEVSIEFHKDLMHDQAQLIGDKDQLLRLFNNLIKNATQAIETIEEGKIQLNVVEEKTHFNIEIADNGIGIKDADQQRIFEPNFTTKTSGTGLGLAMCKSIVSQMGGEISFTSSINEGTTFNVKLKKPSSI